MQGSISFPGIDVPIRMTAVRTNGASPDKALIWAQLQAGTPDCTGTATLAFQFNGVPVYWTNALCDKSVVEISTRGHMQVFTILDSRWRWAKAYITGHYNKRYPDGTIVPSSLKTTAELIQLIFAEIGVAVDVSLVVDTENPEVKWDYDNCADELDELLESRGYVVSLQLDDTAKIWPRNTGYVIPANTDVVNANLSVDPPEIPLLLTAVGDQVLVESMLKGVPIGKDTDGSIKEAKDLSYNPGGVGNASGWDGIDLVTCAAITDPEAQKLALETVGRWWQVKSQADGTQSINAGGVNYVPGDITVSDVTQLLPLNTYLVSTTTDIFGQTVQGEAYLSGVVYDDFSVGAKNQNTAAFTRLDELDFELDKKNGIIKCRKSVTMKYDPVMKYDPGPVGGTLKFADLYLTCSYSINPASTLIKDRYLRSRNLGGFGEDIVKDETLLRTLKCNYTAGTSTMSSITDNESTVDVEADVVLDNAQNNYQTVASNVVLYRGVYQFATDGVNVQVQWNCAMKTVSPFSTLVSQYAESLPLIPTAKQKAIARRSRMRGRMNP